jgi:signal transduction histidine kinase
MGMGLHICSEIVRAHGGRLWAENNQGPGLTVHCLLPGVREALLPDSVREHLADAVRGAVSR